MQVAWQHVSIAWTSHERQVCIHEVVFRAVGINLGEDDECAWLHTWCYPYCLCTALEILSLDFKIRPLDFAVAGSQLLPPCQLCSREHESSQPNHCCRSCMKWLCCRQSVSSMRSCNFCRAASSSSSSHQSDSEMESLASVPRTFVAANISHQQPRQRARPHACMNRRPCVYHNTADSYGGSAISEPANNAALRRREKTLDSVLRCLADCINRFSELLVLFPQANNFTFSDEFWNARLQVVKCLVAAI